MFDLGFHLVPCFRVSNSLDPDQDRHFVSHDLGPNCLQALSTIYNFTLNIFVYLNLCSLIILVMFSKVYLLINIHMLINIRGATLYQ